jgi:excisionase family DNA binding protein
MKTYSLQEAADFLRIHPKTLARLAAAGVLPGAKIGARGFFPRLIS